MHAVELPDGSGFFVAEVGAPPSNPIYWNPFNKVVQDHRTGDIIQPDTDLERSKRGFPKWDPIRAEIEVRQPPAF